MILKVLDLELWHWIFRVCGLGFGALQLQVGLGDRSRLGVRT